MILFQGQYKLRLMNSAFYNFEIFWFSFWFLIWKFGCLLYNCELIIYWKKFTLTMYAFELVMKSSRRITYWHDLCKTINSTSTWTRGENVINIKKIAHLSFYCHINFEIVHSSINFYLLFMAGYEILMMHFSKQQMFSKASNIFRKPTKKQQNFKVKYKI